MDFIDLQINALETAIFSDKFCCRKYMLHCSSLATFQMGTLRFTSSTKSGKRIRELGNVERIVSTTLKLME